MPKRKFKRNRNLMQPSGEKAKLVLVIGLVMVLLVSVASLANLGSARIVGTETVPQTDLQPASFSPGSPSKEYIYAGGRMVATDEPTGFTPTSDSFPPAGPLGGRTGTITVLSNTNWSATSNASWIHINPPSSGTGNGQITYTVDVNGMSQREGTITIAGKQFLVAQGAAFLDVPETHQFYLEIGKISARKVTAGCGGGNYCPGQSVLRDQMAAFIIKALGEFNPPMPPSQRFDDGPPTNIFYKFIEQMAVRKLTAGCGGNNYCPSAAITHDQMAAFIIKAKGEYSPAVPGCQRFGDVPPSNIFYSYIERMGALGIWPPAAGSGNCNVGNYGPSLAVTRGDMARILVRAFDL